MNFKVIDVDNIKYAKQIMELFKDLYWAKDRTIKDIEHQINNSLNVAIIDDDKNLIAYARVITDYRFISTIVDVVVKKEYRNKGLGKIVIKALLENNKLKNVKQHELYCKDSNINFYKQLGFELKDDLSFMRLTKKS